HARDVVHGPTGPFGLRDQRADPRHGARPAGRARQGDRDREARGRRDDLPQRRSRPHTEAAARPRRLTAFVFRPTFWLEVAPGGDASVCCSSRYRPVGLVASHYSVAPGPRVPVEVLHRAPGCGAAAPPATRLLARARWADRALEEQHTKASP